LWFFNTLADVDLSDHIAKHVAESNDAQQSTLLPTILLFLLNAL
jgi:hypothetical protein